MGNAFGTPMGALLIRIEECLLPDDRELLLDTLEKIQGRVSSLLGKKSASQSFVAGRGVPCILRAMKTMMLDDVVLRLGVAVFDYQKENKECMIQFITSGGMTILDEARQAHPLDSTLASLIPVLQKYVRGKHSVIVRCIVYMSVLFY
jgi:hypothetical protein